MLFASIPGLKDVKATLLNSVKQNHIAHAQLFAGNEGGASMAMALAYATYINCENKKEDDACGECASCYKFNKIIHPDLHFIFPVNTTKEVPKDASSALFMKHWRSFLIEHPYGTIYSWATTIGTENKKPFINAEESRNIIKTLSLKSYEGEYKVMVIWLPELMKTEGANAILKILEEPPEKTIFLMVSNSIEKLLTTIQSRTQKVMIPPFTDEEIKEHLVSHHQVDEKKAARISFLADGNMFEALEFLNDEQEENNHDMFRDWMRLCFKLFKDPANLSELNQWTEAFGTLGREGQKNMLLYGINIMRETLVFKHAGNALVRLQEADLKFVENFSNHLSNEGIEKVSHCLNETYFFIDRNSNAKISFMNTSFFIANVFSKKIN